MERQMQEDMRQVDNELEQVKLMVFELQRRADQVKYRGEELVKKKKQEWGAVESKLVNMTIANKREMKQMEERAKEELASNQQQLERMVKMKEAEYKKQQDEFKADLERFEKKLEKLQKEEDQISARLEIATKYMESMENQAVGGKRQK